MRKALIAVCGVMGAGLLVPAGAGAAPTCSYTAVVEAFSVALDNSAEGAKVTIVREGANLQALNANGAAIACSGGGATVNNTDLIEVTDVAGHSATVVVSMQAGAFVPGANTPPDSGTPEIDFQMTLGDGSDQLQVEGTDNADNFLFGESAAGDLGANLNANEGSPDVDMTASGVDSAQVFGRQGDDDISAVGNGAFAAIVNPLTLSALTLEGNNQSDFLRGGAGADSLLGGTQDDNVRGGGGDDAMDGGENDDKLDGGVGADGIEGGVGTDRVFYDERTDPVTATIGSGGADDGTNQDQSGGSRDNIGSTVEHLTGGSAGDSITGSTVRNVLNGGGGDDNILGLDGNDDVEGEDGNDSLDGGSGKDDVRGAGGSDTGRGGSGADDVRGGDLADKLFGGAGADFLKGDKGKDSMSGQAGNDRIAAKDKKKDQKISCGKGKAKKESATVDKSDPKARSC